MDEMEARLVDLPTSVRGFCYHDEDGEAYIVLNARLTREQNQKTYLHEKAHITRGEMYDPNYHEHGGESHEETDHHHPGHGHADAAGRRPGG